MRRLDRLQAGFVALGLLWIACMAPSPAFLQQRAQVSIYIAVNVVPGPLGSLSVPRSIGFDFAQRAKGSTPLFDAPLAGMVAATNQGSVPVQANVQANPTGNLLVGTPNALNITQGRGTTQTYACSFNVNITTAVTGWNLYTGLTSDFDPTFPGGSLAWNIYLGSPPTPETYSAYKVYSQNNNTWVVTASNGGNKNYCVDLQLTIPQSVPLGTYSTNAVYTLYY